VSLPDDRELARAFLAGDERAFRELYARCTPTLYRILFRLGRGQADETADLVQETWLRATRALPGFRWDAALSTWLVSIAINCLRERQRTTRSGIEPAGREASAVESHDHRIDLEQAIAALPDGYRDVFVLHDIEGYTHEEIAGLLAIEAGTSKSQLSRARRALRAALNGASR
jgi:RNA polymerase sigma-70 factor (ECF subfamily)